MLEDRIADREADRQLVLCTLTAQLSHHFANAVPQQLNRLEGAE